MFKVLNHDLLVSLQLEMDRQRYCVDNITNGTNDHEPMLSLRPLAPDSQQVVIGMRRFSLRQLASNAMAVARSREQRQSAQPLGQWLEIWYNSVSQWLHDNDRRKDLLAYMRNPIVAPAKALRDGVRLTALLELRDMSPVEMFDELRRRLDEDRALWVTRTEADKPVRLGLSADCKPGVFSLLPELDRAIAERRAVEGSSKDLLMAYLLRAAERHWTEIFSRPACLDAIDLAPDASGLHVRAAVKQTKSPPENHLVVQDDHGRVQVVVVLFAELYNVRVKFGIFVRGGPSARSFKQTAATLLKLLSPAVADALWSLRPERLNLPYLEPQHA